MPAITLPRIIQARLRRRTVSCEPIPSPFLLFKAHIFCEDIAFPGLLGLALNTKAGTEVIWEARVTLLIRTFSVNVLLDNTFEHRKDGVGYTNTICIIYRQTDKNTV